MVRHGIDLKRNEKKSFLVFVLVKILVNKLFYVQIKYIEKNGVLFTWFRRLNFPIEIFLLAYQFASEV